MFWGGGFFNVLCILSLSGSHHMTINPNTTCFYQIREGEREREKKEESNCACVLRVCMHVCACMCEWSISCACMRVCVYVHLCTQVFLSISVAYRRMHSILVYTKDAHIHLVTCTIKQVPSAQVKSFMHTFIHQYGLLAHCRRNCPVTADFLTQVYKQHPTVSCCVVQQLV